MKVYKGTDKDMKCRGLQYEQGVEVKEDQAELCVAGLHACKSPLDVLKYYAPNKSRYFEGEAEDVSPEREDDSKIVCKRLTIGAEIGIEGLVNAHVEYVKDHLIKDEEPATNTGNRSAATNTGDCSAATAGGKGSVAIVTGYNSKAKADLGCAICVCERDDYYNLLAIKAAIVDGETIKADTWYTLVNGEFVEVEEDQ